MVRSSTRTPASSPSAAGVTSPSPRAQPRRSTFRATLAGPPPARHRRRCHLRFVQDSCHRGGSHWAHEHEREAVIGRLRERQEWKLFAVLPRADRRLAAGWWVVLVLRGLLPAAFAVVMGVLVGAVQ